MYLSEEFEKLLELVQSYIYENWDEPKNNQYCFTISVGTVDTYYRDLDRLMDNIQDIPEKILFEEDIAKIYACLNALIDEHKFILKKFSKTILTVDAFYKRYIKILKRLAYAINKEFPWDLVF